MSIYLTRIISYQMYFIISLLLFFINCNGEKKLKTTFFDQVKKIENIYITDKTLSVFSIGLDKIDKKWVLSGETTTRPAYIRILELTDSLFGQNNIINNLSLLPDSSLGDSIFGIINVSVTPIREKPRHSSQMVDQAIMGNTTKLLQKEGEWYLMQTDYDYVGWISKTGIIVTDSIGIKKWKNTTNYKVSVLHASIFSLPYETSQPITDIILNNIFFGKKTNNNWISVILPDGRSGFTREKNLKPIGTTLIQPINTKKLLFEAYRMTGVPYLWGGNSSKANDCSGFTQTVFKSQGMQLPRDARQQALLGEKIIPDETWENILPGDLLFFGEKDRVTHVGISTGKKEFIHQGGMVKINSLDKKSPVYAYQRSKSFLYVKRILP
mgnify:FL=1